MDWVISITLVLCATVDWVYYSISITISIIRMEWILKKRVTQRVKLHTDLTLGKNISSPAGD